MEAAHDKNLEPPLDALKTGFRKRTWKTAKLTTKAGLRALSNTLAPRSPRKQRSIDGEKALRAAKELVGELDALKGLMMKVGQMASYLDPTLPPEAQQVLAKLQAGSQPMSFSVIDEAVFDDLGARTTDLFDNFERRPFAAASIGQVHRANLDGRELAVKVQYPGIEEAISSDLSTMGALARLGTLTMALDTREVFAELRERLLQECDYEAEARHQRRFASLLTPWPDATVPDVSLELSGHRVLTSSFAEGMSFHEFVQGASQEARDNAARLIFDICYSTILRRGVYNADPHPGNYLIGPSGEVTFLDFGCVYEFTDETIALWKEIALAYREGNRKKFREGVMQTGQVLDADRLDWDHHWNVIGYIYEPFMQRVFRFTHDYVRRSYDLLIWRNPNAKAMTFPREWLWVNRLVWGLNSVLAFLEARGPWPELWWSAIEAPLTR